MTITKRDSLNNVTYHSADSNTDQSLIAPKVNLKPKKFRHSKRKGQSRINTSKTAYSDKNRDPNGRLNDSPQ